MNEKFITEVLQMAIGYWNLDQIQCKQLDSGLRMILQKYEVKECCTDIMDIEKSYLQYLQIFLIRKKTEGKSDRTLEQYQLHLSKLLQYLNKPLDKITEDDLFIYLASYKKSRNVSNTYLDNMRSCVPCIHACLFRRSPLQSSPLCSLRCCSSPPRPRWSAFSFPQPALLILRSC